MLVDYHMHTPVCAHAEGEPAELVERAIALGLAEIGISEHSPWMIQKPDEKLAPTHDEFAQLVQTIQQLQARYNDSPSSPITVRLGIEMDYVPDRLDQARDYAERYPWDYVIGSVHHLGEWGFDNPAYRAEFDRRDIDQVYADYFARILDMVATGLIDIVGHIDVIKKFGHRPDGDIRPLYRRLAAGLRDAGVVVELNTSGRDKEAREFYPSPELLDALARAGVPITLGSDAHRATEVGRYFPEARRMLLDHGIESIVGFEQRRRRTIPLR